MVLYKCVVYSCRYPQNPPASQNGAPCDEPIVDEEPCGQENCTQCNINGIDYPVMEIIPSESVDCEKEW